MVHHRFEHLRRGDHRLSALGRLSDDPLLDQRHERRADLDTEIAARDHHRVRLLEHVVQRVDGFGLFDLRNHVSVRSLLLDERLQIANVGSRPHERERDEVAAQLERKLQIAEILAGQRRDRDRNTGQVDALLRRDDSADDDSTSSAARLDLLDAETDHPVVDQHLVPRSQHLTDRRRCNRELPVPGAVPDDDGHLFPLGEVERLRKTADPELRALQVADQRKWTADLLLHVPDELRSGRVVVVRPV